MPATENSRPADPATSWPIRAVLFLLLFGITFTFPNKPTFDLDASWRMALGKFFLDDLQFGRDVVFTYGPLGYLMGKTYSGLLFWSLLAWQLFAATSFSLLVLYWSERLAGWPRFFFFAFFLGFGLTYEDALHMLMIALVGFELLRRSDQPWRWSSALLLLLLVVQSVAKFTNLMLAAVTVGIVVAHALWIRRPGVALRTAAWFVGGFLLAWILCRQSLLNLPAYLHNSWLVSQGYQEVMGIATPPGPLWKAIVVLLVLAGCVIFNLCTARDRPRAVAYGALLGAVLYLNFKHGFVRSDGHTIGFFYCALLPLAAFPVLLEDGEIGRRVKRWLLGGAAFLCVLGIRDALPVVVDSALGIFQYKLWTNAYNFSHLFTLREEYDARLAQEVSPYELPRTRAVVGARSLDVFGFDQAVAIYGRFNYQPRPVFQSYSAYTPELARLNADHYTSDHAPEFVLLKINSIDERLPAMDDSAVLYLLTQRYTYVHSERSFQLWEKNPGPFDPKAVAPEPVAKRSLAIGEPWSLEEYGHRPLWLKLDLQPSLLGRLRTIFYKPPFVHLQVVDSTGKTTNYRMPAPIGRAGFIISPIIDDLMAFTHFASDRPERFAKQITVMLDPADRKYFAPAIQGELSGLKTSLAGQGFFTQQNRERFYMFPTAPISFEASAPPSIEKINGTDVMVMHVPSEMVFDLPAGATTVEGLHGMLAGSYTDGGHTNGADFVITWSDGKDSVEIYRRFLDPATKPEDRGLTSFKVDLKRFTGGRLYFRTGPGPYNDMGWDWTAWRGIRIR